MYSVHYPCCSYDQTLDVLSLTKTNSPKTSSLPLADFWHPERNFFQKEDLFRRIGASSLNLQEADYCFEYPTPAFQNRESGVTLPHSKSSMTDLMILLKEGARITIEAKYTEYVKEEEYTPILDNWYQNKEHKKAIIQCWIDYINRSGCGSILTAEELLNTNPELPYQFLHRTASACFMCKRPILVYQLFYDNDQYRKMKKFENLLKQCAENLKLNSDALPFFIVETEVVSYPKRCKGNASGLFTEMKLREQYKFGNTLSVLDGYTLSPRQ